MTRDEICDWIAEFPPLDEEEIILFDGLEDAFLGVAIRFEPIVTIREDGVEAARGGTHRYFAVYSYDKIIEGLVAQGMDHDEAVEYYGFNIEGAYVGETTPAVLYEKE